MIATGKLMAEEVKETAEVEEEEECSAGQDQHLLL